MQDWLIEEAIGVNEREKGFKTQDIPIRRSDVETSAVKGA